MNMIRCFFRQCSNVLGYVAVAFLALMMIGITADALIRTALNKPITGVFEFSEVAMVIIVFLGMGWTQLDDAHIRVTILRQRLNWRAANVLDAFAWLAAAVALGFLAYPATNEAIASFEIREFRWGHIEFPIWWAKIALAIGLWFATAQMACHALMTLFAPRPTAEVSPAQQAHHAHH